MIRGSTDCPTLSPNPPSVIENGYFPPDFNWEPDVRLNIYPANFDLEDALSELNSVTTASGEFCDSSYILSGADTGIFDTGGQVSSPQFTEMSTPRSIASSSENGGRYGCKECFFSFKTSYELEQHARSQNHKAYSCGCGRGYSRRDVYVRHVASHKTSERHVCTICARNNHRKVFKRKDHLRQHERNCHSVEVPRPSNEISDSTKPSSSILQALSPPRTCSTPSNVSTENLAVATVKKEDTTCPLIHSERVNGSGCQQQDNIEHAHYQSTAMEDIAKALRSRYGARHREMLQIVEQYFDLDSRSTTTRQLAMSLVDTAMNRDKPTLDGTTDKSPLPGFQSTQ